MAAAPRVSSGGGGGGGTTRLVKVIFQRSRLLKGDMCASGAACTYTSCTRTKSRFPPHPALARTRFWIQGERLLVREMTDVISRRFDYGQNMLISRIDWFKCFFFFFRKVHHAFYSEIFDGFKDGSFFFSFWNARFLGSV